MIQVYIGISNHITNLHRRKMAIAMMAMATLMARGTMSTVSPAATSWEEMWRDVSPIRFLSFSSLKRPGVSNVSVPAISLILILSCLHGWQKSISILISPYLITYGIAGRWNEGPDTWPWCHLDSASVNPANYSRVEMNKDRNNRFHLLQGHSENDFIW